MHLTPISTFRTHFLQKKTEMKREYDLSMSYCQIFDTSENSLIYSFSIHSSFIPNEKYIEIISKFIHFELRRHNFAIKSFVYIVSNRSIFIRHFIRRHFGP